MPKARSDTRRTCRDGMFKLMKIAVLSDIHGNMEAFREVVKYLEKEQIKKSTHSGRYY